jgi:hypothetical protein
MLKTSYKTFPDMFQHIRERFYHQSIEVHPKHWQGIKVEDRPEMASYELLNVAFDVQLDSEDLDIYRADVEPNLPWADDHFLERVCGEPINPGIEYKNWPWAKSSERFLDKGQFNHNYMERYWPRFAGKVNTPTATAEQFAIGLDQLPRPVGANRGIREIYGDMLDIVHLLVDDPYTRQAWIPIFFPEDTGIGERKPCSLGYQFIMRNNRLHVYYPLRSCDFLRHFRDDIYLTIRLLLWVLHECRSLDPDGWRDVKPGCYNMHCTSLHIFKNDWIKLFGRPRG